MYEELQELKLNRHHPSSRNNDNQTRTQIQEGQHLRHTRTSKHNIIICIYNVAEAKMRPSNVYWIYLVHTMGNNILSTTQAYIFQQSQYSFKPNNPTVCQDYLIKQ